MGMRRWGVVEMRDAGQGVQTFSCKLSKFRGPNVQHEDYS